MQFSASNLSSRGRFTLSATVALIAAGMLAVGISVPASASPSLTDYTVKVVNKAGTALTGIDVYALQVSNGAEAIQDPAWQAVPVSGKAGYYKFSATQPAGHKATAAPTNGQLQVGTAYTLEFDPTGTPAKSAFSQLLGGATFIDDAKTFTPGGGNTTLTASLAGNGIISGKITGPTGKALSGAAVQAYNFDGTNWFPYSFTYTSSTGAYSLTDIDPGSYRLEVYPAAGNYAPIYSGGAHTFDAASSVYVGLGGTATVNAKFTAGTGSIAGTSKILYTDYGITVPFEKATPVAIPVTTTSGGFASAINLDKSVYGAASSSTGAWSITGLTPGQYLVQMQPYYIGDPAYFIGAGAPVSTFTQAKIFTVGATKVSAGTTTFSGNAEQGAYLDVNVDLASAAYKGVLQYSLTNDTVSYESEQVSNNTGGVQLGFDQSVNEGNGGGLLQPGKYTLTVVDPSGTYSPFTEDVVLQPGENDLAAGTLALALPSPQPGFSSAATIAQTATTVGTRYTVAATPTRSTATPTYQWFRGTHSIFGADAASYTSIGADVGSQLSVRVTESEFGLAPQYSTAFVSGNVTAGAPASNTGTQPSLAQAGNQFIGTVLSANPGVWNASGLTFKYRWFANGATIPNATGRTYTLTAANVQSNAQITFQVLAARPGYADSAPVASSNAATGILHTAPVATTKPTITYKISGSQETATVKTGKWSVAGVTLGYSWTAPNGAVTTGASTTFVKGTMGAQPRLAMITASKAGYVSGSTSIVASKGTQAVQQAPGMPETLIDATSGTPVAASNLPVGDKIAIATHGSWTINGNATSVTPTYRWSRTVGLKTTVVSTSSSYTISSKDLGATFQVVESASSASYASGISTAVAVGVATTSAALTTHPATVKIAASAAPGQTVKPTITGWPTTSVTNSYQWYEKSDPTPSTDLADYTAIPKATGSSLKLGAGWSRVVVRVKGSKAGYASQSVVSTTSLAVNAAKVTHAPTLTNTSGNFSVNPGAATPAGGTWSYSWYDGASITSTSSPAPTASGPVAPGHAVYVEATYTAGTSTATVRLVAQKGTAVVDANRSVVGSQYGQSLTLHSVPPIAMPGRVAPTIKYQWYVNGKAISKATKSSYAAPVGYIGKSISARVTASSALYNSVVFTSSAVKIGNGSFANATAPTVTYAGSPRPGTVLTAVHGTGYPSGTTLSYIWRRSVGGGAFTNIAGATKSTYTLSVTDSLAGIDVVVKSSKAHFTSASLASARLAVSAPLPLAATVAPSLTGLTSAGTAQVGVPLTVNPGTWNTASLSYGYQWYRNNIAIPGATGTTYTPTATTYGDLIQARVSVARTGYGSAGIYTQSVTVALGAAPTATSTPKITKSGSTYVVSSTGWTVDGLTFAYQWQVAGVNGTGAGATTDTYTPTAGERGQLAVIIRVTRNGYAPGAKGVTGPILAGAL